MEVTTSTRVVRRRHRQMIELAIRHVRDSSSLPVSALRRKVLHLAFYLPELFT